MMGPESFGKAVLLVIVLPALLVGAGAALAAKWLLG